MLNLFDPLTDQGLNENLVRNNMDGNEHERLSKF